MTIFFDGMVTVPTVVLPDKTFSKILNSWPISAVVASDMPNEDQVYQERLLPKLLSEVQNENRQNQRNG